MIDFNEYFYKPANKVSFIPDLYENLKECIDKNTFHISVNQMLRADLNEHLVEEIRKTYSVMPISDISIFKNNPGFKYNMHRDRIRKCAINILLSDEDEDFEVLFYDKTISNKFKIPYRKGVPLLINTRQYHSIKNNSDSKIRYVLSIGCTELDFNTVKKLLG